MMKRRRTQWTSISYHPEENSRPHRRTYTYDEKGSVREVLSFSDEGGGFKPTDSLGSPYRQLNLKENDKSLTILFFNVDGTFGGIQSFKYDRRGNEIEYIEYDGVGSIIKKVRNSHRFDRLGNLIQLNTYKWSGVNGRDSFKLSETSFQTIKYFKR